MKRRFDVIPLTLKTDDKSSFWVARIFYNTVATIQTGEIGEIGNIDKIKTSIFRNVDEIIEDRKNKKLVEGYIQVEYSDLEELKLIIVQRENHNFGEVGIDSELDNELDEINDDVNDFLMERGLSFKHHICLMENGDVILKYYVLDEKMAKKMIVKEFGDRIDEVRQKIKNWS